MGNCCCIGHRDRDGGPKLLMDLDDRDKGATSMEVPIGWSGRPTEAVSDSAGTSLHVTRREQLLRTRGVDIVDDGTVVTPRSPPSDAPKPGAAGMDSMPGSVAKSDANNGGRCDALVPDDAAASEKVYAQSDIADAGKMDEEAVLQAEEKRKAAAQAEAERQRHEEVVRKLAEEEAARNAKEERIAAAEVGSQRQRCEESTRRLFQEEAAGSADDVIRPGSMVCIVRLTGLFEEYNGLDGLVTSRSNLGNYNVMMFETGAIMLGVRRDNLEVLAPPCFCEL